MKYIINSDSPIPAYEQIYEQLRRDIIAGVLPTGSKLISKRSLAGELGVSVITVEHALALLSDEGYIQTKERSGSYVAFGGGERITAAKAPPVDRLTANACIPGDFPFSVYAKTMRRVLSEYDSRVLNKSPDCGCRELREEISRYLLRSRGIEVGYEQIIIGSGAEYLYSLVAQLLERQEKIGVEEPCYRTIRRVYEANGRTCVGLTLGADGIVSGELENSAADALHVTPFHSYPSGVTASAAKRREYVRWAEQRKAYIVEDDYDSEFASPGRQIETIFSLAPQRVIYINTFSRTVAPAVRTGYMVLPGELLSRYKEKLGFYSCTVPTFEQLVLAEFIRNGDMERYINRRRKKLRLQEK